MKKKFSLILLTPLFLSLTKLDLKCPPETYMVEFKASTYQYPHVWCQKKVDKDFIKVGPEYELQENGELILPGTKPMAAGTAAPKANEEKKPTFNEAKINSSLVGAYSGTLTGLCKNIKAEGTFLAHLDSNGVAQGSFSTSNVQLPLSGEFTGKANSLGDFSAKGQSMFDCEWTGKIEATQVKGSWSCLSGETKVCSGDWKGQKEKTSFQP